MSAQHLSAHKTEDINLKHKVYSGKMFITYALLFLVTFTEAERFKGQDVDVTEDFGKPIKFGNIHRDGSITNAFVPYALSQKMLDPPEEPPLDQQPNSQDSVASVRDLYERKRKLDQKVKIPTQKESEARSRMWFDFEEMLDKNDKNSGVQKLAQTASKSKIIGDQPELSNAKHFSQGSFRLNENLKKKRKSLNWTTCEQIGGDLMFHPKDIVDIEWLPFYTWSLRYLPPVYPHVFSIPSVKTVQEYQTKFKNKLNIRVDWKAPKIMMKENQETLLIAADRAGLFYGITNMELPEYARTHSVEILAIKMRLKIFDPYLFLMYCDIRYATVMAINGRGPNTDELKTLEAATIPFKGQGLPVTRNFEYERMRLEARLQRKLEMELHEHTAEPEIQVEPRDLLPSKRQDKK